MEGAYDTFDTVQRLFEYVFVEKQNRCHRLVLRRRGHVGFHGQVGEEAVDVGFGQFARMAMAVRVDESLNPI
jgi:hypothetical protein